MSIFCRFFLHLVVISSVLSAGVLRAEVPLPTDKEVEVYRSMYQASVLGRGRFEAQPDPDGAAREDIYLSRAFTALAEESDLVQDKDLLADVEHYRTLHLLSAVLERFAESSEVSAEQVEKLYTENIDAFTTPEQVTFQHIFFLVPPNDKEAEEEKEELAARVAARARRGADFSSLVAEFSEIEGAEGNEGRVGPVALSRLNTDLQTAMGPMNPGDIEGPVRTRFGFEIILLLDRSPKRVSPLDEVARSIEQQVRSANLSAEQDRIAEIARERFPATVHRDALEGENPPAADAVIVEIADRQLTYEQLLLTTNATHAYNEILDDRERVVAALDRLVLTEQLRELARAEGILDEEQIQFAMRLIRERLIGEQYYRRYRSAVTPDESELRAFHAANPELFLSRPSVRGKRLEWRLPAQDDATSGDRQFARVLIERDVRELLERFRAEEISRDDVEAAADQVIDIPWTLEGPMGYRADMAFFSTEAGNFTEPWTTSHSVAVGWVEEREPRAPQDFESIRDRVLTAYIVRETQREKEELMARTLAEFARRQ